MIGRTGANRGEQGASNTRGEVDTTSKGRANGGISGKEQKTKVEGGPQRIPSGIGV